MERNGILDAAVGSKTPLAGPDLASRTTPAVALVTVTIGPGGLGGGDRFRLLFSGSREQNARAKKYSAQGGADSKPTSTTGKVVTDSLGEIHDVSGDWLPFGLGPQCLVGIERLPDSPRQTTWHVRQIANFLDVTRNSPVALPSFPSPGGAVAGPQRRGPGALPFSHGGPRSHFGYSQPASVMVIPVRQTTEYRLGSKSADGILTIKKHYELTVLEPGSEPSPLTVSGDGTLLFDSRAGLVRSLHFTGKLVCDGKDSSLVVPFTYNYKLTNASAGTGPYVANSSTAAPPPAMPVAPSAPATPAPPNTPATVDNPPAAAPAEAVKEHLPLPDKESREKAGELVEEVFGAG